MHTSSKNTLSKPIPIHPSSSNQKPNQHRSTIATPHNNSNNNNNNNNTNTTTIVTVNNNEPYNDTITNKKVLQQKQKKIPLKLQREIEEEWREHILDNHRLGRWYTKHTLYSDGITATAADV